MLSCAAPAGPGRARVVATRGHGHRAALVHQGRFLAQLVVEFAQRALGQRVGDGECFALVETALRNAGARDAASFARIDPDADYVWGRAVPLTALRPGDILQFRDFQLQSRVIRGEHDGEGDGGLDYTQSLRVEAREHHTAIVERVDGASVVVLEQNVEPEGQVVQRNRLAIASGTETIETPDGDITTDVRVQGDIHAYRPVPAMVGQYASGSSG